MAIYYRTRDNTEDYGFEIVQRGPHDYRAYIVRQPSYRGRPTDAHSTHRLTDERGTYVCWTHPLTSREDALTVAASWAEGTQRYIATGQFGTEIVTDWRRADR